MMKRTIDWSAALANADDLLKIFEEEIGPIKAGTSTASIVGHLRTSTHPGAQGMVQASILHFGKRGPIILANALLSMAAFRELVPALLAIQSKEDVADE